LTPISGVKLRRRALTVAASGAALAAALFAPRAASTGSPSRPRKERSMRVFGLFVLLMCLCPFAVGCGSGGGQAEAEETTPAATVASDTASETPAPDPIEGCVPACNPPGITDPGPLPTGPYETEWFFGGEMVISPKEAWSAHEDSTGEFAVGLNSAFGNDVFFWEDIYPVENEKAVNGVPMTADGLLGWMSHDPRLVVSKPHQGAIGNLPATVVDVSIAKDAENEDPGCPAEACVLFLGFPQWDGFWGIAKPQVQRFYLSDVSYGGKDHLFVAVVYPGDPSDMKEFSSHGEELLSTVQVPADAA
jgi:hypothetical protein